ncbi:protein spartin isoform X2 [Macrosteles quadrilineatus]|uniref:protein spartin isoform X2 n=1 Tax=Macrosteles quadrilineatus TaxID=74068 RepID=UPI0023E2D442|nr:protein spartin isoform X2 [Macrosteles quadrilineatus]
MALGEEIYRRNSSWPDTFNELKSLHDQAYMKIDEALKYDEEGQKDKALASYDQGLMLLDKALAVNIECPSSPDLSWERACCMMDKMRKTRKEILSRVADTQVQPTPELRPPERPEDLALEPPPSYDEAMATSPSSSSASNIPSLPTSSPLPSLTPRTYGELGEVLQTLKVETNMQSVKVMFHVDGVRVYFISPDGSVSAPSQPTQLRVLELEDGREEGLPKYFLQVGEWFYPLVPDVSPCFRSDYGAFILPDVQSQVEGAAVGLILPPEADISLFELLEDVLHGVVSQPPTAPPRTRTRRDNFSTTISKGIVTGLIKGAEAASNYVSSTTPKIISKLSPEEPRPVPPTIRTGAKVARSVTHTAVNVTGFVGDNAENTLDENEISEDETSETKTETVDSTETTSEGDSSRHKRHRHKHRQHLLRLKSDKNKPEVETAGTSSEQHKRHRHKHRSYLSKYSKTDENETPTDETNIEDDASVSHRRGHRMSKLSRELNKLKLAPSWQPLPRPRVKYGKHRASATLLAKDHGSTSSTDKKTGKVGSATMALGRYLAPHVQKGGTKLLAKVGVAEDKAAEGVGGVLTVAAGAVEGFGTIYTGLEQSANLLGSSLANNTVKIVQHKYGEPMAEVTGNTLYTVGNVYNTTNNISNLTPKGLAKKTAKNTGKALVDPHRPDVNGKPDQGATDKPSTSTEK